MRSPLQSPAYNGAMWTAITREVSPALAACELSFVPRAPIDVGRAQAQHDAYCAVLESLGCGVIRPSRPTSATPVS